MEEMRAPMSGSMWKVECAVGDTVQEGDVVMIMESMKMEVELFAPATGVVKEIRKKENDPVEEDDVVLVIDPT